MKWLLAVLILVVYALHQDSWLWQDRSLVFGFLPAGLAYHAGYCLLAAILMAILVKSAWPSDIEQSVADLPEIRTEASH